MAFPAKETCVQEPGAFGSCEPLLLEHMAGVARYRHGMCEDGRGRAWHATLRNSTESLREGF